MTPYPQAIVESYHSLISVSSQLEHLPRQTHHPTGEELASVAIYLNPQHLYDGIHVPRQLIHPSPPLLIHIYNVLRVLHRVLDD